MRDVEKSNLTHCKYHIVFSPKYRKKAMFGSIPPERG